MMEIFRKTRRSSEGGVLALAAVPWVGRGVTFGTEGIQTPFWAPSAGSLNTESTVYRTGHRWRSS